MQLLGKLKNTFLAPVLTVVAEFIGIKTRSRCITLPILGTFSLILGLLILSFLSLKIPTIKQMEKSADYIGIAVTHLDGKSRFRYRSKSWYSLQVQAALLLQELGHFLWYHCTWLHLWHY